MWIPWLTAASVVGGPVEEKDILLVRTGPVGPARPPAEEIAALKGQLASETDPGTIVLIRQRLQVLEERLKEHVEAEQIAGRNIANETAQRQVAEQDRAERAAKRKWRGFAPDNDVDVRERRAEIRREAQKIGRELEGLPPFCAGWVARQERLADLLIEYRELAPLLEGEETDA